MQEAEQYPEAEDITTYVDRAIWLSDHNGSFLSGEIVSAEDLAALNHTAQLVAGLLAVMQSGEGQDVEATALFLAAALATLQSVRENVLIVPDRWTDPADPDWRSHE